MSSPAAASRQSCRLLIVEDEAELRVLIELAAQRTGAFSAIMSVPDGQEALALIAAGVRGEPGGFQPHVVFTDYQMPRLSGVDLARSLRRDPATRRIAVALFTASSSGADRAAAKAAGCCALFSKPLGFDALLDALNSLPAFCRDFAAGRTRSPFLDEPGPASDGGDRAA